MTSDERQALREKHTYLGDYCGFCVKDGGYPADYPCDVIKVLDALEEVLEQVNYHINTEVECEHLWLSRANAKYQWTVFTYCPKCGEKL